MQTFGESLLGLGRYLLWFIVTIAYTSEDTSASRPETQLSPHRLDPGHLFHFCPLLLITLISPESELRGRNQILSHSYINYIEL